MENAGPLISHAVMMENSTVSSKMMLVSHTAVAMMITPAVKTGKAAFQTESYAAHSTNSTATENAFLKVLFAAQLDNHYVSTLMTAKNTAAIL